jgi:calcineurin-like phosphoesterase family protein
MTIFFTADTHFGHNNIVPLTNRPFMDPADAVSWRECKAVGETIPSALKERLEAAGKLMDNTMIANWNAVVKPKDEVWHLGDFHMSKRLRAADYLRQLNGSKRLIRGNHDDMDSYICGLWHSSTQYAEIRVGNTKLVLFHYAMRVWSGSYRKKAIQLFGHSHGILPPLPGQCDVGVDCWNFTPVTLEQILERMQT